MDLWNQGARSAQPQEQRDVPAIILRTHTTPVLTDLPRHWLRGDPFATAFLNSLSAVFPVGETFMMRSVAAWRSSLSGQLRDDCDAFVQQEAGHSSEHDSFNAAITGSGYDLTPLKKVIEGFVGRFARASDLTKLGATMCIEHFTAMIAAEMLHNDHHLAGCDPKIAAIWHWHAVEEIEHKAVAFDIWQHATRDWSSTRRYLTQTALMLLVTASFFINRTRGQLTLLEQDGMSRRRAFFGVMRHGFGKSGIARNIIGPWLKFLKPGFHPWRIDDRATLAKGRALMAQNEATSEQTEVAAEDRSERRKSPRLAKAA